MKIIVGLGNPGIKYKGTRHNVGYEVIDEFLKIHPNFQKQKKFKSYIFHGNLYNEEIILVKPLTFVNLSGESVSSVVNFFKITLNNLLVVSDDLSIPIGKIRLRSSGSSGGHNGLQSIISHLKCDMFSRCRVGIMPKNFLSYKQNIADFVLSKFNQDEKEIINKAVKKAVDIITECIVDSSFCKNATYNVL